MYEKFAKKKGWVFKQTDVQWSEHGGCKEAIAMISGEDVFASLKFETGGHRVQRIPATETKVEQHD